MEAPAVFTGADVYQRSFNPQEYLKEFYTLSDSQGQPNTFLMENLRSLFKMFSLGESCPPLHSPRGVGQRRTAPFAELGSGCTLLGVCSLQHGARYMLNTYTCAFKTTYLCLQGIASWSRPGFWEHGALRAGQGALLRRQAAHGQGWGLSPRRRGCPRAAPRPQSPGYRGDGAVPRGCATWDCISGLGEAQPDGGLGRFCPGVQSPSSLRWSSPTLHQTG